MVAGGFSLIPHRDKYLKDHLSSDQRIFGVVLDLHYRIFHSEEHS